MAALAKAPGVGCALLTPKAVGRSVPPEMRRQAARRLVVRGQVVLGVGEQVVDPAAVRETVQVRRCRGAIAGR